MTILAYLLAYFLLSAAAGFIGGPCIAFGMGSK